MIQSPRRFVVHEHKATLLHLKKKDRHAQEAYAITTELTPARIKKLHEQSPPCETTYYGVLQDVSA